MWKIIQLLVLISPLVGFSQTDTIVHLYTFGGGNNDAAEEIETTSDGGYIIIGSTSSNSSGNTDAYLLKVDSMCNYQWSKAIGGTNNDLGYSVKETFDKGFIIALTSNSNVNGGYNAVLNKRDSLGNNLWKREYGGTDWDFVYSVTQTYDSGFVFCGETYNNSNGFSDVYVVKTSSAGDTLWTRTYGGSLIDKGNCVIETSDSNIVVAGVTNTVSDSTDIYVIKLSPNGTLLWDSIYGNVLYENANSIIETTNGDFVINGTSTSYSINGDKDFYLIRIDHDGVVIWENNYGAFPPEDEEAFDLFEDSNGDIVNVGYTKAAGSGLKDGILFYISASGSWQGVSPTFGAIGDESFTDFAIGNNGEFCMAGFTNSFGSGLNDMLLVRLDTIYASQDTSIVIFTDAIPLTINEHKIVHDVILFPNPLTSCLNVELKDYKIEEEYVFEAYTGSGKLVKKINFNSEKLRVEFNGMPNQFLIYKILESGNLIACGKLIVN